VSTAPAVAKTMWSDADFDQMGWHDNAVHAVALEPAGPYPGRLLVDLDYILTWEQPTTAETTVTFWVSPATLVFERASDLMASIDLEGSSFQLSLDAIDRSGPVEHGAFAWTLDGHNFSIILIATGFTQYLRRPPIHTHSQRLPLDQRGGISFNEQGYTL
jgi:hypothetical protein